MERSTHLLTPTSLKALAHPIRVELLGLLRTGGPSTATELARRTGESSGTTSYHLRQLAAADLVAEAEGLGNGRERWWRAAQDVTVMEPGSVDDDPVTLAAADAYLDAVVGFHERRLRGWVRGLRGWPKKWRDAGTMDDDFLSLNATELARLNAEVWAVVESYRRPARKGDERVAVQWAAFPVKGEQ